jgi:hypothetical protein
MLDFKPFILHIASQTTWKPYIRFMQHIELKKVDWLIKISKVKPPDHNAFPIRLQDLEVKVMLDTAGKELMMLNILFLNIYDAVMVNNAKDCDTAKQVIEEAFQTEFGIVPAIDIKVYKPEYI